MDPLSLTASIIAVLGAARTGAKALQRLNRARKAPREIGELLGEVTNFEILLERVQEIVGQREDLPCGPQLQCLVERGGEIVGETNSLTTASSPHHLHFLKLSDHNRARVALLRNGSRLKSLRENLQVVSLDLAAALSLLTACDSFCLSICLIHTNSAVRSSSIRIEDAVTASAELQHETSTTLSAILEKISFVEESTKQLQQSAGKLIVPTSNYSSTVSRLDLAETISGNRSLSSIALIMNDPDSSSEPAPRRASDPLSDHSWATSDKKGGCPDWCSCTCHSQITFTSPWTFKTLFGQILIEYASKGTGCNEYSCRRSDASSINMTYHLPRYLMSRYLALKWHCNPLDGPRVSLQMPRIRDWQHPLFKYANTGDLEAIQNLFTEGKASPLDVNPRGTNALIYAAAHANLHLGQFLIEQGADPQLADDRGCKPIELYYERAFSGQFQGESYQLIRRMFKDSDFLETRQFSVLHKIVLGLMDDDLGHELGKSTALINNADAQGRTPLCWATIRDDLPKINVLLRFDANPNIPDNQGNCALHFARSPNVCKSLLKYKADVYVRNRLYSRTPLHGFCKRSGPADMIDLLVEAGLEVDCRDADGETPLLNAIFRRFSTAAQRLIELGANVKAANYSSQEAAIHFAVTFDHHEILPLLLEKGADYTAVNVRGRNIGHMAARTAGEKTISILAESRLWDLDLSLKDEYGKTAMDYLLNRRIISQSEIGINGAFERLQHSVVHSRPARSMPETPRIIELSDDEMADVEQDTDQHLHVPGAFPIGPVPLEQTKEEIWRDTLKSFRCDYKSPCCHLFDAPRGVCSGVISYQSADNVS